jgi:hypothetical protein
MSWAESHQDSFWRPDQKKQPPNGWLGVWNPNGNKDLIAFVPYRLEKFLKDETYEPRSIIRIWKDDGYLKVEGSNLKCKVMRDGDRTRYYVLKRKGFLKKKNYRVRPNLPMSTGQSTTFSKKRVLSKKGSYRVRPNLPMGI